MNINSISCQTNDTQTSFKQVRFKPNFNPLSRKLQNAKMGNEIKESANNQINAYKTMCRTDLWNKLLEMKPVIYIGSDDISYILCNKGEKETVKKMPYALGNFYTILHQTLKTLAPDLYNKHLEIIEKYKNELY